MRQHGHGSCRRPRSLGGRVLVGFLGAACVAFAPVHAQGRLEGTVRNSVGPLTSLASAQVRLHREDGRGQAWAVIAVRDHGIGIPAGDLPHVFAWFHRAQNVVGKVPGTGIGLAGARHIVEQHGGTIDVESQVCAGSTFTIRLPLDAPEVGGSDSERDVTT